jgi:NAD(P)H-dependent FMN reductase
MGAGGRFGTVRAQTHLRDILIHNNNFVVPGPEVTVARASQEFDVSFNLINEQYRSQIGRLLQNLADLTRRLQAPLPVPNGAVLQPALN